MDLMRQSTSEIKELIEETVMAMLDSYLDKLTETHFYKKLNLTVKL